MPSPVVEAGDAATGRGAAVVSDSTRLGTGATFEFGTGVPTPPTRGAVSARPGAAAASGGARATEARAELQEGISQLPK